MRDCHHGGRGVDTAGEAGTEPGSIRGDSVGWLGMAMRRATKSNTATATASHIQLPTVSVATDCDSHLVTRGGVIARV